MKRYQTITLQVQDGIATLCLNRPDKKNAINFLMIDELLDVAKQLQKSRDIFAVKIMGAKGDFSAGLDLGELNNPKNTLSAIYQLIKPSMSKFQRVCLIWQQLPMPVIAVVQGVCLGGGLQLALGADIRIVDHKAKIALLEAKWGLVADMGITHTAYGVRSDVLKQLAMTAEMLSSIKACELGLMTHVSDTPELMADDLIAKISSRSPDAVLAAKRVVNAAHCINHAALYQEKYWQLKLLIGKNRCLAIAKAYQDGITFVKRQFR